MSTSGLKKGDIHHMKNTFVQFPEVEEVRIFGSRAMGNFKPGSDVDLALFGKKPLKCTTRISGILNEELPLPYFFDVMDYDSITNPDLKKHINEYGKIIYQKSKV